MPLDNRNKQKSETLEEIENDNSPIEEEISAKESPEDESTEEELDENGQPIDTKEEEEEEEILADDEEIDQATGEIIKKVEPVIQKKELPDVEERLKQQRREAIILNERNKQLTETFTKAADVKEPTEKELKEAAQSEGFEWDELDAFQQKMFKKEVINEKKLSIFNEAGRKITDVDARATEVDTYIDTNETNQTNKELIGKEHAFREFAMRSANRIVPLEILLGSFLHDYKTERPKQKGSIMLTKTGGDRMEKKARSLNDAEFVQTLRKSNPKEYNRLVAKGKISIDL